MARRRSFKVDTNASEIKKNPKKRKPYETDGACRKEGGEKEKKRK
jgi:hypothetical protein